MQMWMLFVVGAILAWGCYVPTIHEGQTLLGGKPKDGALRAFLCVGIAYFLTAVVIPGILLANKMEAVEFNTKGTSTAILAGAFGAAGAICIILAIKFGGKPLYIAPLVFAGAPVVNVLVSMLLHPPKTQLSPMFFLGMVLAASGAGMVLYFKPSDAPAAKTAAKVSTSSEAGQPVAVGAEIPVS